MDAAVLTLIILGVSLILFVSEVLPMGITAFLVSLTLYLSHIIDAKTLFGSLANTNVVIVVAMCVIGKAFFNTGMAYKTGRLITRFTKSERWLTIAIMMVSGIMSGFLSNTGTVAVLMPVVIGIARVRNIQPIKLLIPLTTAATIGADLSIAGSPGNLIAKSTIEQMSNGTLTVSFFEYSKIGVPLLVIVTLFMGLVGYKLIPDREADSSIVVESTNYDNVPVWKANLSLAVLAVTIIGMVLSDSIKWLPPLHIIASMGAAFLVVTGVLSQKEAFDSIEMQVVFLVAFMLPLGTALSTTGAGKMLANMVIQITGKNSPLLLLTVLYTLTWIMTQFMSNTATCTLLCPVGWQIAEAMGADPRAVVIAILIASSAAVCTPLAIPANAMIMGPSNIRFKDFIVPGLATSLVCAVISIILLPIFYPFY
jgi:anion transporter